MTGKPNIVLIITDQQRFDTINALGAPWQPPGRSGAR